TGSSDLFVGASGGGAMTISSGGSVPSDAPRAHIGNASSSFCRATGTGAGSTWTNTGPDVGGSGTGALTVQSGGAVSTGANGANIGANVFSSGMATITGSGSSWTIGQRLDVGSKGDGNLMIAAGGSVADVFAAIGTSPGPQTSSATVTGT